MHNPAEPVRVLVVADVWCQIDGLCAEVHGQLPDGKGEVVVIAPALTRRLHTLVTDIDAELRRAQERLDNVLSRLEQHGVVARGEVGDADPELAIDDILAQFAADKIVLVTETRDHRNRHERKLVEHLEDYRLPIRHIVVDHDVAL
jgi:hypothetical protein